MPNLHVGQIWRPTRGRALPKVIVTLGEAGVIVTTHPRIPGASPSCLSMAGWAKWVEKYGAVKDE